MTNIIVAFPRIEEGKSIKNILVRSGFHSVIVCTTGTVALGHAEELRSGILVSGYKLPDMLYSQLMDELPQDFEMLLIASSRLIGQKLHGDVVSLSMPLKTYDLVDTINMMAERVEMRRKERRRKPKQRSKEEMAILSRAKGILMDRNNFSEEEAHRYLQKCSMDTGTDIIEAAQMVLSMLEG